LPNKACIGNSAPNDPGCRIDDLVGPESSGMLYDEGMV